MFDELYQKPSTLARHKSAPYAEERANYLRHCALQGYSRATLLQKAMDLLWVARKLSEHTGLAVNLEQLEAVAQDWEQREASCGQTLDPKWTRKRFVETGRPWLRFLGCFDEPATSIPFSELLADYIAWAKVEGDLAPRTIQLLEREIGDFLRWYAKTKRSFEKVMVEDIDAYLSEGGADRWCRKTVRNIATTLRGFFRYASRKGWCRSGIAEAIQAPRVYSYDSLPGGPNWEDVQRLLASAVSDQPQDIRDFPVLLLFALYGLRVSEVVNLKLDDIDWESDLLCVTRVKRLRRQTFPLLPALGNAVARYLKETRPPSDHRALFLTLLPPYRPVSRGTLYSMTRNRFLSLGIGASHRGPHALRHACATHLLAEGLSMKEIGDHLGHRSASSTRVYAKVDLNGLREIAAFDLGDVI